jgi:hypothetical protein
MLQWMWPTCFTDCRGIHRSSVGPPNTKVKQKVSLDDLDPRFSSEDLALLGDLEKEVDITGVSDVVEQLVYLAKPGKCAGRGCCS